MLVNLSLKVPRESENSPEQTAQLLASLARATSTPTLISKLMGKDSQLLDLEIRSLGGQISFNIICPKTIENFIKSQLAATYPDIKIENTELVNSKNLITSYLSQNAPAYFPLRDYADYKQVDPMLPLLGVLAKLSNDQTASVTFTLAPANKNVVNRGMQYITPSFEDAPDGKTIRELPAEEKAIIKDKLSHPLVNVLIKLSASNKDIIKDLSGAMSVLNRPDGNSLILKNKPIWNTLNVMELSSLWHLPGTQTKIPNLSWAPSVALSESPEDLPTTDVTFFAKTSYHNSDVKFGIKLLDRLRHMYVLGKSGTGKSTLLENMAIDDFKKGRGLAFIDPHGDSSENLLNYIPSSRINDTIYFNPDDREFPIKLNILEISDPSQVELAVSGIMSIFHKIYGKFWGPRMQYIMRNALLSLVQVPGSTLPDLLRIFADYKYRSSLYPKLPKALVSFWTNEYDSLDDKTQLEYTYPIINKVGQFVNSPLISGIISSPKSTINLADIMNKGKIFIANLSKGKLGEDNAALLGAMIITKIELAAMSRVNIPTSERKEFFLYVDEFQNFATDTFINILSEARKFKLGLILANQYIAQISEEIQMGIFGNAGTIISFVTGNDDAKILTREFAPVFDENSLVNLQKYQIILKMCIDGNICRPFTAETLPPLKSTNQNRDKVISESRKRWT
ncbi:MAG: hypothetical protein Q8L51_03165 [Candidatus Amesbacteria bacterium]|nr:hypothetical protein [Candidatus Amesbacteria bacterium]